MEFKFKRKYTNFFLAATALHLIVLYFWFFFPKEIPLTTTSKQTISLLALINCELILIFYLGLFRKKYYAYHDKILIKRSFFKTFYIRYADITSIEENPYDSIIFNVGNRPSFKIRYKCGRKEKKYTIRSDNTDLLLKVIKNEIKIAKSK